MRNRHLRGEPVEDVIRHRFQPTAFEVDLGVVEVDRIFLAEEERSQRQFRPQTRVGARAVAAEGSYSFWFLFSCE